MAEVEDSSVVRFTTKEMFASIDKKLDAVIAILEHKADGSLVADHEQRIRGLEKSSIAEHAAKKAKRSTVWAAGSVVFSALSFVASHVHIH